MTNPMRTSTLKSYRSVIVEMCIEVPPTAAATQELTVVRIKPGTNGLCELPRLNKS